MVVHFDDLGCMDNLYARIAKLADPAQFHLDLLLVADNKDPKRVSVGIQAESDPIHDG
jgi:hypothetical protein